MSRKLQSLVIVCCVTSVFSCSVAQPPEPPRPRVAASPNLHPAVFDRVAIYVEERTNRRIDDGTLRQLEDEFVSALLEKGYNVAARSNDLERVLREQRLQESGETEAALAEVGRAMNVQGILLVSVNDLSAERYRPVVYRRGERYYRARTSVSARLIDAELAQVMWIGRHSGALTVNDRGNAETVVRSVGAVIASALPDQSHN